MNCVQKGRTFSEPFKQFLYFPTCGTGGADAKASPMPHRIINEWATLTLRTFTGSHKPTPSHLNIGLLSFSLFVPWALFSFSSSFLFDRKQILLSSNTSQPQFTLSPFQLPAFPLHQIHSPSTSSSEKRQPKKTKQDTIR